MTDAPTPWPGGETPAVPAATWSRATPEPGRALAELAARHGLGEWRGGVPIDVSASTKVVGWSGAFVAVGAAGTLLSLRADGGGAAVGAVLSGAVGLLALLVLVATLVDMAQQRHRAVQVYDHGLVLPQGARGWYAVPWASARIDTVGGEYDEDGWLLGNPTIDWRIGVPDRERHISMLEVTDEMAAAYHHAYLRACTVQHARAMAELRAGREVVIGDVTLRPDGYRGTRGSGPWSTLVDVTWSRPDHAIVVHHQSAAGVERRLVTGTDDDLPNRALVIALMRSQLR
ncbi:hypothetical protein [Nocardioides sp. BYT-33-1]|uniref:hypothetical protein n=1 Tax=Nocardioides sp. BYT-33-1 TaxID=3416952 RepID=UPI003F52B441